MPPQELSGGAQLACARTTQRLSHEASQQKGSMPQTVVQQAVSEQLPVPCSWKQLPASGSPQALQMSAARIAHCSSQATWQQ